MDKTAEYPSQQALSEDLHHPTSLPCDVDDDEPHQTPQDLAHDELLTTFPMFPFQDAAPLVVPMSAEQYNFCSNTCSQLFSNMSESAYTEDQQFSALTHDSTNEFGLSSHEFLTNEHILSFASSTFPLFLPGGMMEEASNQIGTNQYTYPIRGPTDSTTCTRSPWEPPQTSHLNWSHAFTPGLNVANLPQNLVDTGFLQGLPLQQNRQWLGPSDYEDNSSTHYDLMPFVNSAAQLYADQPLQSGPSINSIPSATQATPTRAIRDDLRSLQPSFQTPLSTLDPRPTPSISSSVDNRESSSRKPGHSANRFKHQAIWGRNTETKRRSLFSGPENAARAIFGNARKSSIKAVNSSIWSGELCSNIWRLQLCRPQESMSISSVASSSKTLRNPPHHNTPQLVTEPIVGESVSLNQGRRPPQRSRALGKRTNRKARRRIPDGYDQSSHQALTEVPEALPEGLVHRTNPITNQMVSICNRPTNGTRIRIDYNGQDGSASVCTRSKLNADRWLGFTRGAVESIMSGNKQIGSIGNYIFTVIGKDLAFEISDAKWEKWDLENFRRNGSANVEFDAALPRIITTLDHPYHAAAHHQETHEL